MGSYYRQQLEQWLANLEVRADKVFDIGGKQLPVKGRTKTWEVKDYQILDLPDFDIEEGDSKFLGEADLIFCLEVFEYLIDPIGAMETIHECLKTGGKAYVTFAFVYPHHNELDMDSLRYTETGVKRLARHVDLTVKNIWRRGDRSGLLQQFYTADKMHPAREYPYHNTTGIIAELEK